MEKVFQLGTSDDEIVAALQEPQPILRERAIALAARHLAPETLGRFVADDENAVLRNAALSALERQGPYAVPHLVALSRGENAEVAMFAVQILSRIKDPGRRRLCCRCWSIPIPTSRRPRSRRSGRSRPARRSRD